MALSAVYPRLRPDDLHVLRIVDPVREIVPALLRLVIPFCLRFAHLVSVRIPFRVILLELAVGVGIAIPDRAGAQCLRLAAFLLARPRQRQRDLRGVVVFLSAVYPRLRPADRYVFRIVDPVREIIPALLRLVIPADLRFAHLIGIRIPCVIIHIQSAVSIGVILPYGRLVQNLIQAARFFTLTGQGQPDIFCVIVFLPAVDPGLCSADFLIFRIMDRVGKVISTLYRRFIVCNLIFCYAIGIEITLCVILSKITVGVGIAVPYGGSSYGLGISVRSPLQRQCNFFSVIMRFSAVHPGLLASNIDLFLGNGIGENFCSINVFLAGQGITGNWVFCPGILNFLPMLFILGQMLQCVFPVVIFIEGHNLAVGQGDNNVRRPGILTVIAVYPHLFHLQRNFLRFVSVGQFGNQPFNDRLLLVISIRLFFLPAIVDPLPIAVLGQAFLGIYPLILFAQHGVGNLHRLVACLGAVIPEGHGQAFRTNAVLVLRVIPDLDDGRSCAIGKMFVGKDRDSPLGRIATGLIILRNRLSPVIPDFLAFAVLGQLVNSSRPFVVSIQHYFLHHVSSGVQGHRQSIRSDAVLVIVVVPYLFDSRLSFFRHMGVGEGKALFGAAFFGDGIFRPILHLDDGPAALFVSADLVDIIADLAALVIHRQRGPGDRAVRFRGRVSGNNLFNVVRRNRHSLRIAFSVNICALQPQLHVFPLAVLVVSIVPDLGRSDGGFGILIVKHNGRRLFPVIFGDNDRKPPDSWAVDVNCIDRAVIRRGGRMAAFVLAHFIRIDAIIERQLRKNDFPRAFSCQRIHTILCPIRHGGSLRQSLQPDGIIVRRLGDGIRRNGRINSGGRSFLRPGRQSGYSGHGQRQSQQGAQPFLLQHHGKNPPFSVGSEKYQIYRQRSASWPSTGTSSGGSSVVSSGALSVTSVEASSPVPSETTSGSISVSRIVRASVNSPEQVLNATI